MYIYIYIYEIGVIYIRNETRIKDTYYELCPQLD